MNMSQATNYEEFAFSDANFALISGIAKRRFGLDLQPSKKPLVYSRLTKRLRKLGLNNFDAYCAVLEDDRQKEENGHLLSALTTNVTHFFREAHHFELLSKTALPPLLARARKGERIRIWSAACSAGQEAYSIAATVLSAEPKCADLDIRILATDIDPQMIDTARISRYPLDQKQAIPAEYQQLMLASGTQSKALEISEPIKSLVSFGELNLIEKWPMKHPFDVIFCRNAAIYFDKATQAQLWMRFANSLVEGGYLMIGHSERLSGGAQEFFRSAGITTYQKQSPNKAP